MSHRGFPVTIMMLSLQMAVPNGGAAAQSWLSQAAASIVFPQFVTRTSALKERIAYGLPGLDTSRESSLHRLDAIFADALDLTEGDMSAALLICALSTIPYRAFDARIPGLGILVHVPISFESDSLFQARRKNLPARLFYNSPEYGDRDKVAHFFGSAWLQCNLRMSSIVRWMGLGVEVFEKIFFLEGAFDVRDVDANVRGIRFGNALMREENVEPSHFFRH